MARMARNLDGRNDFIVVRRAIRIKITGGDKRPIGSYVYCIRMAAPLSIRPRNRENEISVGSPVIFIKIHSFVPGLNCQVTEQVLSLIVHAWLTELEISEMKILLGTRMEKADVRRISTG